MYSTIPHKVCGIYDTEFIRPLVVTFSDAFSPFCDSSGFHLNLLGKRVVKLDHKDTSMDH